MEKRKSRKQGRLGIFNTIILSVNAIAVIFLLLSYLAVHVSPARYWILPFFGLAYPYLLLINGIFVIAWFIRRKWYGILSLIVILMAWNHIGRIFRFSGYDEFKPDTKYFKLTCYNVKNLSNDNVDLVDHYIRNNIIEFLGQTGSDIICLQELMIVQKNHDAFIDSLSTVLGLPYHSYVPYSRDQKKFLDAIFIFSRFPIVRSGELHTDSQHHFAIYSDIVTDQDTLRLFNVHLESVRLKHEDYSFISGLDLEFQKEENIRENSLRIIRKLKTAYAKRSLQAEELRRSIEDSPYPVVLCGDFNDTPNSYVYHKLSQGLTDAFMESGSGFGNSYIGKLPSFRIDFIFHDDHFLSTEFKRHSVRYSDHYPISCYLGWK